MKHRPFSELTKHWSPERLARNEAKVKEMLAELDREEREQAPGGRTSRGAEKSARRPPELTR
ncbi:MAG: hypothetical protein F4057_05905 [Acidobacteria bacterium]|nr:hypothetical protein [Acidobacteriota bacterium]